MNWTISAQARPAKLKAALAKAEETVDVAENESDFGAAGLLSTALCDAAVAVAKHVAEKASDELLVTIQGHETLTGEGFRPAHLTLTVSKVHPEA